MARQGECWFVNESMYSSNCPPAKTLPLFQVLCVKIQSQWTLMINEKRDRETRQLPYNSGIKKTPPTKKYKRYLKKSERSLA
jgi:hypothetical protein